MLEIMTNRHRKIGREGPTERGRETDREKGDGGVLICIAVTKLEKKISS